MPWKNRSGRSSWKRGSWKSRGPSTKTLARTKAPKRYNWVESLESICNPVFLQPHICAPDESLGSTPRDMDCGTGVIDLVNPVSPTLIVLVPPNDPGIAVGSLGAYDSDDVTVVRITGHILMMPMWFFTADALAIINAAPAGIRQLLRAQRLAQRHFFLRAGKKKESMIFNNTTEEYEWPHRDPLSATEWLDGRFSQQWEREMLPGQGGTSQSTLIEAGSIMGCCSNVIGSGGGGGSSTNILTDGSGNIDTEIDDIDISTECEPCDLDPANFNVTTSIQLQRQSVIRLNFNSKARVRLRENEGLGITLNYTAVDYTDSAFNDCFPDISHSLGVGFLCRPHIKVLIET